MRLDLTAFFERLPIALLVSGFVLLGFSHMLVSAEWDQDARPETAWLERLQGDLDAEPPRIAEGAFQLEALREELKRLLKRYTDAHPDVIFLRQRIGALERDTPTSRVIKLEAPEGGDTAPTRIPPRPRRQTPAQRPEIPRSSDTPAAGAASFYADGTLRIPVTVKEVAGVGAIRHPSTLVLPLPYGRYQVASVFRMTDASGAEVAAQFEVLDRWWARDRSIRHLRVDFQPSVEAYVTGRETTGTSRYYISDDGPANAPTSALRVVDGPDQVEVVTGPLRFTVNKRAYSIIDRLWLDGNNDGVFDDDELIVEVDDKAGGILLGRTDGDEQRDRTRLDVSVTVEQAGPLRAVIKAEAPARYLGPDDHTHGFAVRMYAYAGKSHVKVDYQLQNSDKQPVHAGPLYFQALAMSLQLRLQGEPRVRIGTGNGKIFQYPRGRGLSLAQERQDAFSVWNDTRSTQLAKGLQADGFLEISDRTRGVAAFLRFFWETWPNGIEVSRENRLSLQPFPRFGAQWYRKSMSPTGLYWLQDMQHVYKEALLVFHNADLSDDELRRESMRFDRPPVSTVPTGWHAQTRVTLDLGGAFPVEPVTRDSRRTYDYAKGDFDARQRKTYRFNWANFYLIDPRRKKFPASAGSWAHGKADYILSESPSDIALLELLALGELNARPHWLAGYRYTDDFQRIKLGDRLPYQAQTWRARGKLRVAYLKGTGPDARPRDDAHGWYHHVRESYYATANPWVKDWFQFIGEHRKAFLDRRWNLASRAIGHALASAIDAYRITGDLEILELAHRDINERLRKQQNPKYGFRNSKCCGQYGEAAFQAGYLARAVINFMEEVDTSTQAYADAFQFLSGLMEWNLHFANFSYYLDARKGDAGKSHGSALTFVDPQAWYYWNTGKRAYWDQIEDYMDGGIGGGRRPFGKFKSWRGQYEARLYRWVKLRDRTDAVPPAAIKDLDLSGTGNDTVLRFSAPSDAVRYHVVWGQNPIVEGPSSAPDELNWWAADAVPATATAGADGMEEVHIPVGAKYAAVFSFDAASNMSALSNLAAATNGSGVEGIVEQQASPREPQSSVDLGGHERLR